MRLKHPETASTDSTEQLLSPVGLPHDAGERLESARAADRRWREARSDRVRRQLVQIDRVLRPLERATNVVHLLFLLRTFLYVFQFDGAVRQALKGTSGEWCLWATDAVFLAYVCGVFPLFLCVWLFRTGLKRWARRQCISNEAEGDGTCEPTRAAAESG